MKRIKIWNQKAADNQLSEISSVITDGGIIIIPTDTRYAIVGDALNMKAIEKICNLKNINPDKTNLSIICSDISMASEYSKIDNKIFALLKRNTPGPFTFILKSASKLPKAFKGRKMVGIRIPESEIARQIAESLGHPLITTGIDFENEDYAVNTDLIAEVYDNKVDLMVEADEGSTDVSTVIDCTENEPKITRSGIGQIQL